MATWQDRLRCDEAPSWAPLLAHAQRAFTGKDAFDLRAGFATDAHRAARFSFEAPHVRADLSKNLIDAEAQRLLTQLAHECGLESHRDALLAGEPINASEQRAVTHVAWRNWAPAPAESAPAALHSIADWRAQMLALADAVRADDAITDVVNIGIGGSDLGPRLVVQALSAAQATSGPRVHFVANMDGHELAALLRQLRPEQSLFLVASKSFGTAETMRNALSARAWYQAQGGTDVARHFVALSANPTAARAFGIERCLGFDEGVGGRYSLWSSIGLSIAIAVGREGFEALLAGAHAMDRHFAETPLARNLPVQLALLDLWYRNFLGFTSRCIAPYHARLQRLPAYLQQLEMESNGKRVDSQGRALPMATAPVLWGEPGSNGQHAFFQLLHQGPDVQALEILAVRDCAHSLQGHHQMLLASALAQAQALMQGRASDCGHRHFGGNRPSTVLLLEQLDPASLGALVALYEHRVFVSGAVWGINSFDQWGVELGKQLAAHLQPRLASGDTTGLDGATAGLLHRLCAGPPP